MALVPTSGTTTYAWSLAGGGGSLIGAQGSYARASENATVSAYGGTGITLPNADVVITAQNDSSQYAQATGLSTGFLAVGATVAQTSSSAHTYAYLGAPDDMDATHLNHTDYTGHPPDHGDRQGYQRLQRDGWRGWHLCRRCRGRDDQLDRRDQCAVRRRRNG